MESATFEDCITSPILTRLTGTNISDSPLTVNEHETAFDFFFGSFVVIVMLALYIPALIATELNVAVSITESRLLTKPVVWLNVNHEGMDKLLIVNVKVVSPLLYI